MGADDLVTETLRDYREAQRAFAAATEARPGRRETKRLRAELDGARLRYHDALRAAGRRVPYRAA